MQSWNMNSIILEGVEYRWAQQKLRKWKNKIISSIIYK